MIYSLFNEGTNELIVIDLIETMIATIPVNTIRRTITTIYVHGMSGLDLIDGNVATTADIIPAETPAKRISNCSERSIRLIFLI